MVLKVKLSVCNLKLSKMFVFVYIMYGAYVGLSILSQCSISVPNENPRKLEAFWRFQGPTEMEYWRKMG